MLEPQTSLGQIGSKPDAALLHKLRSLQSMSADCESVVTQSLHHPSSSLSNTNGKHPHSGISYEGRLSLISPFMNYPPSTRTSLGMDHHSTTQPLSPSFLSSAPYVSPHAQMTNLLVNEHLNGFMYGEEIRRNVFPQRQPAASPSCSKNNFDSFHMDQTNGHCVSIKQEPEMDSFIDSEQQRGRQDEPKAPVFDPVSILRSMRQENSLESTPVSKKAKLSPEVSPENDAPPDMLSTPQRLPLEGLEEDSYMNDDHGSKPSSPYQFRGTEEMDPGMDSDPDDSNENCAALSLMEQSFETGPVVFDHGENSKSLKCQFCSYSTDSQFHFNTHLNSHFDHKCTKCDFTTHTIAQLKDHSQEEHSMTAEEVEELESIRVPKINSQGKVKTFKCKQCGYVAITKGDFWKHARTHIKSEKLLTCNKCPFVTEYKHHLEYHLRNHVGIKPYQCNKCSYSCVNKSMLNSHMKSHSNVYQYRCSNCTYATKYCHSLKLHLRKYGHTPAMVLNPDGTPNPVPIIDVYGTRRGPKLKKDDNGMPILPPHYQFQAQVMKAHMEVTGTLPLAPTAPPEKTPQSKSGGRTSGLVFPASQSLSNGFSLPSFQSYSSFIPQEFMPMTESSSQINECKEQLLDLQSRTEECLNVSKSPEVKEESLKCESCDFSTPNRSVLAHHSLLHRNKNSTESDRAKQSPPSPPEQSRVSGGMSNETDSSKHLQSPSLSQMNGLNPSRMFHPSVMHQNFQEYLARAMMYQQLPHPAFELHQQLQLLAYQNRQENNGHVNETIAQSSSPLKVRDSPPTPNGSELALDLSKEQTPPSVTQQLQFSSVSTASTSSPSSSDVSTPPSKNRRKGRAYKLERIALRLSGSGGEEGGISSPEAEAPKEPESLKPKSALMPPLVPILEEKNSPSSKDPLWKEAYNCQYCDIAFKDVLLYTMHMGYHGFVEAFTCNSCGFKAEDKINFSLHVARAAHN